LDPSGQKLGSKFQNAPDHSQTAVVYRLAKFFMAAWLS